MDSQSQPTTPASNNPPPQPLPNYTNAAANALIQQITEPAAVNVINVNVNVVNKTVPLNFITEIQSMLYAFGDSRRPKLETAALVDQIVRQQIMAILTQAIETSHMRGTGGTVGVEDVAFLMRKHPTKVQNLVRHLTIKDMAGNTNIGANSADVYGMLNGTGEQVNKRAKRCKEFLMSIDSEGGPIIQALNDELHDDIRTERLKRLDRLSKDMDERRYR